MSFLATDPQARWAAVAAIAGIGSFAFPLVAPWHLVFPLLAAASLVCSAHTQIRYGLLASVCLAAVLGGYFPSPLAGALLSAMALANLGNPILGAAILFLSTSVAAVGVQIISQALFAPGYEVTAPALLAVAILVSVQRRLLFCAIAAVALTLLLATGGKYLSLQPMLQMALVALPACAAAAYSMLVKTGDNARRWPALCALALLATSWLWTPPRTWSDAYFILPTAETAPETNFFKNYGSALAFAGIHATQTDNPDMIPQNSLVLLPWLTAALSTDKDRQLATKIGELARQRKWIVVVAGEHNDMGGSAKRTEAMIKESVLRNDLTVPPRNTDDSGPLHVLDFHDWRHEAILNRGATVRITSIWDKVLLAGDGWWAEKDIGEWLWVGDYVWQSGDRTGRLPLAVGLEDKGARWVIVGDNSPLLNTQIYADPRPLLQVLDLATFWPSFLRDGLATILAVVLWSPWLRVATYLRAWLVIGLGLSCPIAATASSTLRRPVAWENTYVRQTGFDVRNFNNVFADNPALLKYPIIRRAVPISDGYKLPNQNAVIFGLINNTAQIGDIVIRGCRRLGALQTSAEPFLMDAQACEVRGPATVVIGTPDSAAAILIQRGASQVLLIFDTAFLSQSAPEQNIRWLTGVLASWEKK